MIGLPVLFFTWIQISGSFPDTMLNHLAKAALSSFILSTIFYEGIRTLYWGYLSNMIIRLGYYIRDGEIDFENWKKETWLDETDRKALETISKRSDPLLQIQQAVSPNLVEETRKIFKFLRWTHKRGRRLVWVLVASFVTMTIMFVFL